MQIRSKIAALLGVAALVTAPSAALAGIPEYSPEKPPTLHKPMPGPSASAAEKTKAYGVYCGAFSKKHGKGQSAPFSRCVNAMATAATSKKSAQIVCRGFAKTHVKGQKGTEFSSCVVAAAKVKQKAAAS